MFICFPKNRGRIESLKERVIFFWDHQLAHHWVGLEGKLTTLLSSFFEGTEMELVDNSHSRGPSNRPMTGINRNGLIYVIEILKLFCSS